MRLTMIAAAFAVTLGTGFTPLASVTAQTVEVGPNGAVGLDLRNPRQRERDYQREDIRRDENRRDREVARRNRNDEDYGTGSVRGGCREVTVRERDSDGVMVTRRSRDCR